jgi:hypothetical protein
MKKFRDLVFDQLILDRESAVVIDNLHGYARIAQRLRYLWDGLCIVGEEKLEKSGILSCLVGIAAMAQHAAESMGLVVEQQPTAEDTQKDKELTDLKNSLTNLLEQIGRTSKPIPSHQLGRKRFSFEFDEETYRELAAKTQ